MAGNGKWYQGGLAFLCRECGKCCSGPAEGYVWINRQEIEGAAKFLGLSVSEFKNKYLRRVGVRYSLIEKEQSKDCIFLKSGSKGKTCEIYSVRPMQCRTWPFWKENIRSRKSWVNVGEQCPGVDKGYWYDCGQIEGLRNGDLSVKGPTMEVRDAALAWIEANKNNVEYLEALKQLYGVIDEHITGVNPRCENCGQCCDFDGYGHRLYVTTLEMGYFIKGSQKECTRAKESVWKSSAPGSCPYQKTGKGCLMREYRPASCRIFYCRDLPLGLQNELTEQMLGRLRSLHELFRAPYYYGDLREWLVNQPRR